MGIIICKPRIYKTKSNEESKESLIEPNAEPIVTNYSFPKNDDEIDRIHYQHYIYKELWGGNFSAPVNKLLESSTIVLDVGCGPGTWTMEMGQLFPEARFVGIDFIPTYPSEIKPPNVSFEKHDILEGFPYKDNTFDYVHMRFMMFAFTPENWRTVIEELIRVCKPNGWIELMEEDLEFHGAGQKTSQLSKAIVEEMKKRGIEIVITSQISNLLESLNPNSEINKPSKKSKLGNWGDKVGMMQLKNLKWGAKNLANAVRSNQLFKNNDGEDDDSMYNKMVDEFFEECEKGETYVISHRFYMLKHDVHVS
ncbi:2780_t:CDS:2 [Funneliformis caledonium]|uniref:2780_t:CDS:1 n=1 Tax=Funneliformis caledonium TaxID=1117310 RepID=A0A9N9AJV3_9GLOM|nr:2780_t:CDS:2 [Funneliformis caledonium]